MTQLKNMYAKEGNRYCSICVKTTSELWCSDGHRGKKTRGAPVHNKTKKTLLEIAKKNKNRRCIPSNVGNYKVCRHRRVSSGRRMLFSSL